MGRGSGMRAVGLGDLAAAARVLLATPDGAREARLQRMLDEAQRADCYRRRFGRVHPRFGNGTLMAAALAHEQAGVSGPGDAAYMAALAQVIEAVLAWRCTHDPHES